MWWYVGLGLRVKLHATIANYKFKYNDRLCNVPTYECASDSDANYHFTSK